MFVYSNDFVIKSAVLDRVCGVNSEIPVNYLKEFAFFGRSNVGKSSLINAILRRKSLARVSAKPGKTQTINYYRVNDEFYLVDLPGYGYTSAQISARMAWGKMVERYLNETKSIEKVFLLLDIRLSPTENDELMYKWIVARKYDVVIVATKCDKLGKNARLEAIKGLSRKLGNGKFPVVMFSALDKTGLDYIYKFLKSGIRSGEILQ